MTPLQSWVSVLILMALAAGPWILAKALQRDREDRDEE